MSLGTLYIHPHSPRSNWLYILIEHLKVDIKVVPFDQVENFKELFPLGKVPAYIENDNGYKLTEFVAIVEYFLAIGNDEIYSGNKNVKDKIQVLRWLSFLNQDVATNWYKFYYVAQTAEEKKIHSDALRLQFNYLENELSTRSYLTGETITLPDVYLSAWFNYFAAAVGENTKEEYPTLYKWYASVIENDPIAKKIANK